ncbi:hypothetical protein B0I37DRAFT_381374 [Chaetomium sp. MPI-CAGE-AT-0009]|nr:hypothetical protein B0I37DRAFT_381374 [Chaetomium sp. MPI-CAGE-AT-0009]
MKSLITRLLHAVSAIGLRNGDESCPTEIRARIPHRPWKSRDGPEPVFASMASIHAAMLRCPNITTLHIHKSQLGCVYVPEPSIFPFDVLGGDRYASAPVVLSLEGYDPDRTGGDSCQYSHTDPHLSFPAWLTLAWRCLRFRLSPPQAREAQETKTNLDLWLNAMDFSQIHTLELNDTRGHQSTLTEHVAEKLPPKLSSLRSLTLHNAVAELFILALPGNSLRYLSWQHPKAGCGKFEDEDANSSPLQRVLRHHGSSLRSFEYHTPELDNEAPPVVSMEELHALITFAPQLRSLTLNLRRVDNGTGGGPRWPWETLKLLAKGLPELTDLTIYFALASECHRQWHGANWMMDFRCDNECVGPNRYAQPLLNKTSAADMARFLRQQKSGQEFKTLTFRAGDWEPPYEGPDRIERWLHGRRVWVTCRPEDSIPGESDIICDSEDTLPTAKCDGVRPSVGQVEIKPEQVPEASNLAWEKDDL